MSQLAMFIVKRRSNPMMATIVQYNPETGRKGKVLASEPIRSDFSNDDVVAAAKRLVPQVSSYKVILPMGVEI